jgi:hypothetical protein
MNSILKTILSIITALIGNEPAWWSGNDDDDDNYFINSCFFKQFNVYTSLRDFEYRIGILIIFIYLIF